MYALTSVYEKIAPRVTVPGPHEMKMKRVKLKTNANGEDIRQIPRGKGEK